MSTLNLVEGAKLDIVLYRGSSYVINITADEAGTPISFDGATALLQVKDDPESEASLLELTDGDGIILSTGSISIVFPASLTKSIDSGSYQYDCRVIFSSGESKAYIKKSRITIEQDVSR